jgi:hypothetical protein
MVHGIGHADVRARLRIDYLDVRRHPLSPLGSNSMSEEKYLSMEESLAWVETQIYRGPFRGPLAILSRWLCAVTGHRFCEYLWRFDFD